MDDLFAQLDSLAERFDCESVEQTALEALAECGGPERANLWGYIAWARFELGRLRPALEAAVEADDSLLAAKAHFHLWEFAEAEERLAGVEGVDDEEVAEAEWYRGLLAEFAGQDATDHFRKAALLAGDLFHEPVRLTDAEIDAVARDAVAGLPEDVRRVVDEIVIQLRPLPRQYPDVDPLYLGIYWGRDRLSRLPEDAPLFPPHIELYQKNIERVARDHEEVVAELRITLLHEIAHHLGYDEDGVRSLGLD